MRSRAIRSFNGPPSTLPFARELYSTARTRDNHFPFELGERTDDVVEESAHWHSCIGVLSVADKNPRPRENCCKPASERPENERTGRASKPKRSQRPPYPHPP
jgi:hypothetical protein